MQIRTTAPAVALDVNGPVRVLNSATNTATCTASIAGAIYYETDEGRLCFCNGTNWLTADALSSCAG